MKTRAVCNYAVVRFLPYPEAGEFVNIGVVAQSPNTGYFDYRLLSPVKTSRVHGLFPELVMAHYKDAVRNCETELKRMRAEIGIHGAASQQMAMDPALSVALFRELIRPRETVIRFSNAGTALVDEPGKFIQEVFERYVLRMFAQEPEYQEQIMQRKVAATLKEHRLIAHFPDARVGNEDYHVHFPFAYQPKIGMFARAIKPLNLAQDQSTKIYDHGEMWLNRIRRLRRIGAAPGQILVPVHRPAASDQRRFAACEEICTELESLAAIVVAEDDEEAVLNFARTAGMARG